MEIGGRGREIINYTVTTRMTPALRWAPMRAILMFHNCEEQSQKTQCPQTTTFEEKREPMQIRTEVPLLTSLSLTARPNRLTTTLAVTARHVLSLS